MTTQREEQLALALREAVRGYDRIAKRLGNGSRPHPQDVRWARAILEECRDSAQKALDSK